MVQNTILALYNMILYNAKIVNMCTTATFSSGGLWFWGPEARGRHLPSLLFLPSLLPFSLPAPYLPSRGSSTESGGSGGPPPENF